MAIVAWAVMLAAGVCGGASLCAALVVPRRALWVTGLCSALSLLALGASLVAIWGAANRVDTDVASAFIALGASGGGFALAASLLPSVTRPRTSHPLVEPGPDDRRVHVVVLADAEPERYSPTAITAALQAVGDSGVPLPPDAARVLVYASERARYSDIGESPARPAVRALAVATSACLPDSIARGQAAVAYCAGDSALAHVLAREIAEGARRIVVAQATVADTRALDSARKATSALRLPDVGVEVTFTMPLWGSADICAMVARRVLDVFEEGPTSDDGVVLVSEGEPVQMTSDFPLTAEHVTFFAQRLRAELVAGGFAEERVRPAWLQWEEPDVTEVLRHLAALGCKRIAVVPSTIMFDTVETLIDLRAAADRAAVEASISVTVLPAWGDDEVVAHTLCTAVTASTREFGGAQRETTPD
jgi:protoheme ferro-lyase